MFFIDMMSSKLNFNFCITMHRWAEETMKLELFDWGEGGASSCVVFRGFLHIALIFFLFSLKHFYLMVKTKSLNNAYLIM